jgi:uncharacterized protein
MEWRCRVLSKILRASLHPAADSRMGRRLRGIHLSHYSTYFQYRSDNCWQVFPECPEATLNKGYLNLPHAFLDKNPVFRLHVGGFTPRFVRPHPYCNQDIVAVARGPIVYCVEDVDNPWASNHFKDVTIDIDSTLQDVSQRGTEHDFIKISASGAGRLIEPSSWDLLSQKPRDGTARKPVQKDLNFVPYYARANRGGGGQMRVGLRIARE